MKFQLFESLRIVEQCSMNIVANEVKLKMKTNFYNFYKVIFVTGINLPKSPEIIGQFYMRKLTAKYKYNLLLQDISKMSNSVEASKNRQIQPYSMIT